MLELDYIMFRLIRICHPDNHDLKDYLQSLFSYVNFIDKSVIFRAECKHLLKKWK